MASKTVKCNNCNIVVCELLAFLQNKIEIMNEEDLVRLCTSCFSTKDIDAAKNLFFESIPKGKSKITRKGNGKSKRDLFDVITLLKELDPELIPIYVAKDLQKLPPITFDHIDATKLLKDILVLQKELQTIKHTYVTEEQLDALRNDLKNLQRMSIVNNFATDHVSRKRGGGLMDSYFLNSGPVGLPHTSQEVTGAEAHDCNSPTNLKSPSSELSSHSPENASPICFSVPQQVLSETGVNDSPVPVNTVVVTRTSQPTVTSRGGVWSKLKTAGVEKAQSENETLSTENNKDEWITVSSKQKKDKKEKNRFFSAKGKASCSGNFKAADMKIPLFINYVDKDTTEDDILQYIEQKTKCNVTMKKINTKRDRGYDAYKVFVPQHKLALFLNEDLWPEGISFRRFVYIQRYEEKHGRRDKSLTDG